VIELNTGASAKFARARSDTYPAAFYEKASSSPQNEGNGDPLVLPDPAPSNRPRLVHTSDKLVDNFPIEEQVFTGASNVQLVDAGGDLSNAGLLQVRSNAGFGSVCGMDDTAATTVCKIMGYSKGKVSKSPCSDTTGKIFVVVWRAQW